jgi:hypothetical protein
VILFEAYRQIRNRPGRLVDRVTLAALRPDHRWLMAHRWPRNVTPGPEG